MAHADSHRPDPLVERIRRGDRRAFERCFRAHYEALCRFARGYVDRLSVAEDLVQEVFLEVWTERRDLDDVERSLRAYLYGMTRHRALKHLRSERVRAEWAARGDLRRAVPAAVPDEADDALHHEELEQQAREAVDALPERRRQIFLLSRRHELTYAEIAGALDLSVKTVETQMSRALRFLRERLEDATAP
ncbi:MAG: RNA polymerase sigma-70 factor [Bacteroidetes bacterium QS_7_67_15]|nr:MAG: RNA polymerase sigma-70 factor [Bacteroidetes bacterium QS_7_67_15]